MHRRIILSTEALLFAALIIVFRFLLRGPQRGSIVIPAGDADLYRARDAFMRDMRQGRGR